MNTESGISPIEPQRENFESEEDLVAAWLDWEDEYPARARFAIAGRQEY